MGVAETITNGREAAVDNPIAVAIGFIAVILLVDLVAKLLAITVPLGFVSLGGTYSPAQFVSQVRTGIVVGLLFGLAGIGLSMTYSILNFANFSHGDLITTGGFAGWGIAYLVAGFGSVELSSLLLVRPRSASASTGEIGANVVNTPGALVVGLIAAILATMVIAVVIDRIVYKPMRDRGGSRSSSLPSVSPSHCDTSCRSSTIPRAVESPPRSTPTKFRSEGNRSR